MFAELQARAEAAVHPSLWALGKNVSVWSRYAGPDCPPFKCYVRYARNSITLSNVFASGTEPSVRKGRMPVILSALSKINKRVIVENVVSAELRTYLLANDFTHDPMSHADYVRVYD